MPHDTIRFPLHDEDTAPGESPALLRQAGENLGKIPNLERVMASSPPLLRAYVQMWELFDETSFTPIERQVVYQTANYENNCTYCVPWHTWLSQQAGMAPAVSDALRQGLPLPDARLEALRVFTTSLIEQRGHPSSEMKEAFFAAGWEPHHALEAILGLAVKLMSNYTNGVAGTPLDSMVKPFAWTKPAAAKENHT